MGGVGPNRITVFLADGARAGPRVRIDVEAIEEATVE
jgi:hypothetical protein